MKQGGISWNGSSHHKLGVTTTFACPICNRKYKVLWAKDNHQKMCEEFNKK